MSDPISSEGLIYELLQGAQEEDGALATREQDQDTPAIIAYFNEVSNQTILVAPTIIGSREITLADVTGATVGKYIILFNPKSARFYTGHITSIAGSPTMTMDTPLDFAYPAGTFVDIAITDMSVNGAAVTRTFGLRGTGIPPGVSLSFDVTRVIFSCIAANPVTLANFAGIAALTNGMVMRKRDGEFHNVFNVKTNGEIAGIMFDWDPYLATNPVQGIDGFVSRLTFNGQNKMGVVQRLRLGEDLEILIQDDLTGITSFKIIAEGHIVWER